MAKYTGKDGKVKTGATPDSVVNLRSFTLEKAAEELDASIIDGNNNYACEGGQESWSGTIEVLYDPADAGAVNLANGAKVDVELYPIGDASGDVQESGTALITGVSRPVEVNGMISQSISFKGDGALTTTTIV